LALAAIRRAVRPLLGGAMQNYQYIAVPFAGVTKAKDAQPGVTLGKQLTDLINKMSADGWEYYRLDHVSVVIKQGCLATLLGVSSTVRTYDLAIFRRPA
jgi:hypothetical protein